MRVGFEIPYYAHGINGSSQYGENLVRAFGRVAPEHEFFVFNYFARDYKRHAARLRRLEAKNVRVVLPRWPQSLVEALEKRLGYPLVERRLLEKYDIDLFHDSYGHPVSSDRPRVMTIGGAPIGPLGVDGAFIEKAVPMLLQCRRVIADSKCIRDMLLKYTPVPEEKIRVVYYGVDHALFRPITDPARLQAARAKYRLPERFMLAVGPFLFRDNIEHVLVAMARGAAADLPLVLVGGPEGHGQALREKARQLRLEARVQFAGFVPHEDLAALYNLALVYLHPSVYEELGAQLLEACASGTPIIAARSGGIEEAAGQAPEYFNPHQVEQFESVLKRVLESQALRDEMREKSLAQGRLFDWDACARQTLEVYRECLATA